MSEPSRYDVFAARWSKLDRLSEQSRLQAAFCEAYAALYLVGTKSEDWHTEQMRQDDLHNAQAALDAAWAELQVFTNKKVGG